MTSQRSRRAGICLALALIALAPLLTWASVSVERGSRTSRLSDAGSASEYWDIAARFDSNHSLFARFLVSNEGPGRRNAFATWYLIDPDGQVVPFRNGRREGRWTLSADRARMEIGSSVLDQRGSVHALEYDSGKRGIEVYLRFTPGGSIAGIDLRRDAPYSIDVLDAGTPVVGTLWLRGMTEALPVSGSISVTHSWMERAEADLALRRIDVSGSLAGDGLFFTELLDPSGARHRWLVVSHDSHAVFQTSDFQLVMEPKPRGARDYPFPTKLRIEGPGVEGSVETGPILVDVNPLDDLPQLFRFLLSFEMRPRRAWAQASFDIRFRAAPNLPATSLQGSGFASATYLNPLPQQDSSFHFGKAGA